MTGRVTFAIILAGLVIGTTCVGDAEAQSLGTAFTYQGRLQGGPCPLRFGLFDSSGGATRVGTPNPQTPAVNWGADGVFTTSLDFGNVFTGADRYLEIEQNCTGTFQPFTPRQRITGTPYALYASVAGDLTCSGCVGAGDLATGLTFPPSGAAGGGLTGTYPNPSIATNAVGTGQIQDGAVMTNDLADNAVTSGKIQDGAVAAADVGFNYAGSGSKGGAASDLTCTGCVDGSDLGNNAVTSAKIASGQVVKSVNGLTDSVTLAAGSNVTITPSGNTLTVASSAGGLSSVTHNATLTGSGTSGSPLAVAYPLGLGLTADASVPLRVAGRIGSGISGSSAGAMSFYPPDGYAWFHIDNGPAGRSNGRLRFSIGSTPGASTEIMSLVQNGNVGIGNAAPASKLHVSGDVRIDCGTRYYMGGAGEWLSQPCGDSTYPIEFYTNYQKRMRMENTGAVEIYSAYYNCYGTPTPVGVRLAPGATSWQAINFICIGAQSPDTETPASLGPEPSRREALGTPATGGALGDERTTAEPPPRQLRTRLLLRAQQERIEALEQRLAAVEQALARATGSAVPRAAQ